MAFIPILRDGYLFYNELRTYGDDMDEDHPHIKADRIQWREKVLSQQDADFGDATSGAYAAIYESSNAEKMRETLLDLAEKERGREMAVLQQFFKVDVTGMSQEILGPDFNKTVIQFYNKILTNMPAVKNLVQQVKADFASGGERKKSSGHMTAATLFGDYFNGIVDEEWKTFRDGKGMAKLIRFEDGELFVDSEDAATLLNDFFTECAIKQIRELADSDTVTVDGKVKLYKDLEKMIPLLEDRSNPLAKSFLDSLGVNSLVTRTQDQVKRRQKKEPTRQFTQSDYKAAFKSRMHITKSTRGTVAEVIQNLFTVGVLEPLAKEENLDIKTAAYRIGGNRSKADALVGLFNQKWVNGVDEKKFNELLDMMAGIGSSGTSDEQIQKDFNKVLEAAGKLGLDNQAFILRTDKNYVLGKAFDPAEAESEGFRGTSFNYDRMLGLLTQLGMFGPEMASTAITAYMNTTTGALFEDKTELQATFRDSLSQIFQEAMFDDINTIRNGLEQPNMNVIHVLNLSGVIVPLSYMLLTMARALDQAVQKYSMSMSVEAKLPSDDDFLFRDGNTRNIDISQVRWETQAKKAHGITNFVIHFGKEFKDLLNEELGNFILA